MKPVSFPSSYSGDGLSCFTKASSYKVIQMACSKKQQQPKVMFDFYSFEIMFFPIYSHTHYLNLSLPVITLWINERLFLFQFFQQIKETLYEVGFVISNECTWMKCPFLLWIW